MKKLSSYLPSLLISVIIVFGFIGMAAVILLDINVTANNCISISKKNALEKGIYSELESYYKDKYNSSGIPAEVYMDAISENYIKSFEEVYINAAFETLNTGEKMEIEFPENKQLEDSIEKFFSDYADKSGYEKDEAYELKLSSTKENAYKTIGSYCDVYKFSALNEHGVLIKLSKLFRYRFALTIALALADIVLLLLLFFINIKNKLVLYYWVGISAIISSILGATPALYLIITRYFDSFSIKQPQVFTAYTKVMYNFTEAFIAVETAMIVLGISMLVIYAVMCGKSRRFNISPQQVK